MLINSFPVSMSDMKHDAIVGQGIPIHERVPIPEELIPEDSRVEIDAKIHAGYCKYRPFRASMLKIAVLMVILPQVTTGKTLTLEELDKVQGRGWDDVDVSRASSHSYFPVDGGAINGWMTFNTLLPRSTEHKNLFPFTIGNRLGLGQAAFLNGWNSSTTRYFDALVTC
jgi:hypothetical protein